MGNSRESRTTAVPLLFQMIKLKNVSTNVDINIRKFLNWCFHDILHQNSQLFTAR